GTSYKVAGSMWSSGYHTGVDFSAPSGTPLKALGASAVNVPARKRIPGLVKALAVAYLTARQPFPTVA
ncbi:hypothetical protein ACFXDP_35510, partial [Streptomyces sp. NPDC059374]